MKRALVLAIASCVSTSPAVPLPVPAMPDGTPIPSVTQLTPFDFEHGSDDVDDGCAPQGARDVSFDLGVTASQTLVFDTLGSTIDVALGIHDGPCPASSAAMRCASSTTAPPTNPCNNPGYNALAVTLQGPHAYCLVVQEASPSSHGQVALRMFNGGREALILDGIGGGMMADACPATVAPSFGCITPPGDRPLAAAMVLACPGKSSMTGVVMPDASLQAAVSIHALLPSGPEPECNIGTGPGSNVPFNLPGLMSPAPYWLLVERASPSCGSFTIAVGLQ